jgi:iron complex outermembrane receptor protein
MSCSPRAARTARLLLLGALLAGSRPVLAQQSLADTRFTIGDIVVTGERPAPVLTSVDVLGGDVAQRQLVDNSWELFARLPGVVLTDFNQGTTSGRFSIRGFNGEGEINAVKLLVDGIPANDNAGGMPFIASVELVRGPADPRWGLHAIAGSAAITTRIGGTYVDARIGGGAFGAMDGQVSAGLERDGFSQNYLVAYRSTDGYRDHAGLDRLNLAGKWFYTRGATRIGAIVRHSVANAEEPGYLTEADVARDRRASYAISATDGGRRRMDMYSLHLDSELTGTLTLAAAAYQNDLHDDRYVRFSANVAQQRRQTDERHRGGTAMLRWHPQVPLLHDLVLEGGGDVQAQDDRSRRWLTDRRIITSRTRDQDFDLTVYGGYVQAVIQPVPGLTITPGWRWDRVAGDYLDRLTGRTAPINDYGTIGQPKVAVALAALDGVTLYGNYGRTFQIGVGSGSYLIPPRLTDVAPSINEGFEGGVKLTRGHAVEARIAVWQQTASGELRRRLNDPTGDVDNLGATRRRGLDVQLTVRPARQLFVPARDDPRTATRDAGTGGQRYRPCAAPRLHRRRRCGAGRTLAPVAMGERPVQLRTGSRQQPGTLWPLRHPDRGGGGAGGAAAGTGRAAAQPGGRALRLCLV